MTTFLNLQLISVLKNTNKNFLPFSENVRRIEERFEIFEDYFGRLATSRLCNLLTCTEFGLSETEILEILMPTNDIADIVSQENGQYHFSTFAAAKTILGKTILKTLHNFENVMENMK